MILMRSDLTDLSHDRGSFIEPVMLLALPILLPLLTAIALQLLPYRPKLLRAVAFAGALGILMAAIAILIRVETDGISVLQVGSWPAPFGITLVADVFSSLLVLMVGILGTAITAQSFSGVDPRREAFGITRSFTSC
jgi:multicomponent Na+:H+ antiporter subunit D